MAPYSFVICLSTVFISVGQTSAHIVLQSTRFISALPGDKVTFDCSMAAGVSVSSYTMHWYRQDHYGQPIQFIIKEYDKTTQNYEAILNTKDNMFSLIVSNLTAQDSSTYYCAASHSQAFFGNGTKLTVLAANVTLPKVKILPPSPKEICSQDKINDKRSTLVCVASGFYPDHVSVSWKVNGVERQDSVSTDTSQDKINDKRSTLVCVASGFYPDHMSRSFACTVHFFNGDEYTVDISKYIE
uniref:Ig-like domain-containing protein n=1 Tax=Sinocyclocheilus anshuiensis TaxID=1608454 RepID=A0A671RW73_9TELE